MSYPIEQRLASKNGWFTPQEARNYYGKYNRTGVTAHWWGGGEGADMHDAIVNVLLNGAAAGTKSANYVVSDIKITEMIGPDNVAFASTAGNPTTISIEHQPTLGAEGYKKSGWLIHQLEIKYGIDMRIYPHSYWNSTECPGTISLDRLAQEANKWASGVYDGGTAPTPAPVVTWNFVAKAGKAQVKGTGADGLWVLKSPQLAGEGVTIVPEGTLMDFVGYVTNGDDVNGNKVWWKNSYGNYFSAAYAPEYVAPAPTPEPTPTPPPQPAPTDPVAAPVTKVTMYTLANAKVVNINDMTVIKTLPIDTPIDVAGECTWKGNKFFLTQWAMDNHKLQGFLVGDLKANPEPAPVPVPDQPEWVKNLRDIDDTEYWIKEDTQLIDITTGKPALINGKELTLNKDDSFISSAVTYVGKKEYRITDYSFKKGIFNGVPIDKLTLTEPGMPDIPPIPVNPPSDPILVKILEILQKIAQFLGIK